MPAYLHNGRYMLQTNISYKMGEGTYGVVYRAHDTKRNEQVAIKICSQPTDSCEHEYHVLRYQLFGEPNILPVHDGFHYGEMFFMVAQLMSRQLEHRDSIDMQRFKCIIRQTLIGLRSLHRLGVVHCDLKPSNVLINDSTGQLVLADFGSSRNISDKSDGQDRTPAPYKAPEIYAKNSCSHASDIWAAGAIFLEIFLDDIIFRPKYMVDWEAAAFDIPEVWTEYLGEMPESLVRNLWMYRISPGKARLGLQEQLSEEPEFSAFIHKFFHWNPDDRITAQEALQHSFLNES